MTLTNEQLEYELGVVYKKLDEVLKKLENIEMKVRGQTKIGET